MPRTISGMLYQNPPPGRFAYIAKTYGEKYPDIVLDVVSILADTIGWETDPPYWLAIWQQRMTPRGRVAIWSAGFRVAILEREFSQLVRENDDELEDLDYYDSQDDPHGRPGNRGIILLPVSTFIDMARGSLARDRDLAGPQISDALWQWIAKGLVDLRKRAGFKKKYEQWMSGTVRVGLEQPLSEAIYSYAEMHLDVEESLSNTAVALSRWQQAERIDLGRYTFGEAVLQAQTWAFEQGPDDDEEVIEGDVVYEFDDGWTVQRLQGEEQLEQEGDLMSHCVGDYCEPVDVGVSVIYSLRDEDNQPHVTIEYKPGLRRFVQVFGKANTDPKPAYMKRVQEFQRAVHPALRPPDELTRNEREMAEAWGRLQAENRWEGTDKREAPVADLMGWTYDNGQDELEDMLRYYPRRAGAYGGYGRWMREFPFDDDITIEDIESTPLEELLADAYEAGFEEEWKSSVESHQEDISYAENDALKVIKRRAEAGDEIDEDDLRDVLEGEMFSRTGGSYHGDDFDEALDRLVQAVSAEGIETDFDRDQVDDEDVA